MDQITESENKAVTEQSMIECFHCGERVTDTDPYTAMINDIERPMCCPGCKAVAETICSMGLSDYYRYRTDKPARPELIPDMVSQLRMYDSDVMQNSFVSYCDDTLREAEFIIGGLVCPACAWLIESRIGQIGGVAGISVNFTDHRCRIRWDQDQVMLSEILLNVGQLGYQARPYSKVVQQEQFLNESRFLIRRLGVAGVLGIQIMMIAVALYQAEWSGMEDRFRTFFHYLSMLLCIPILAYSAEPFFRNAWRDIKFMHPGMDVPVVLGLGLAFTGSVWATISGHGNVYYESVAMFVFFLLLGRYFEFSVRKKVNNQVDVYSRIVPAIANKLLENGTTVTVPVAELDVDDVIQVKPGESVPVDCRLLQGVTDIDESVITGESMPIRKEPGSDLLAGSINVNSPVKCQATHISKDSFVAKIQGLLDSTLAEKSVIQERSNRIASWFIAAVLVLAILVSWYWIRQGSDQWLAITISTLIITCPCALALATPVAMTAMTGKLMQRGILAGRNSILETLPHITHIIFDKTGTLTEGRLSIEQIIPLSSLSADESLLIAAAMEQHSEHPVARAFTEQAADRILPGVTEIKNFPGSGMAVNHAGRRYYLGSAGFVESETGITVNNPVSNADSTFIVLADENEIHCGFYLRDTVRAEAGSVVQALRRNGISPVVMSGDGVAAVKSVCDDLAIDNYHAEMKPEDKLSMMREIQASGNKVMMIGDGINDAPVLAGSDLSVAMGRGTDLIKNTADIIFLNNSLNNLLILQETGQRTGKVIHQNICWAIAYNLLAIPAAITGLVAPWFAALGMSLSSLIVVLNSARLVK